MSVIPFNRFCPVGTEESLIRQAISQGHVSGDGPFTRECQRILEESLGVVKAFLTTSCTHALEMAALLLDIRSGDEVIAPDFTFVSSVNAFVLRGARPVFADIRPDTLNLDEAGLEGRITPKTRAIVVVHYAGVGCEMDTIMAIASRHGIPVIEDNAHGLWGLYRGRSLGSFGCLATQSFHETKSFSCGEGGALLINDPQYIERADILREKGTNRSGFFRGEVDKYTWVDVGSSYLPSDILAAVLYAQLRARDNIQRERRTIWESYKAGLEQWASEHGVSLPLVPEHCEQSYPMFYMLMPTLELRQRMIAHLRQREIVSVFHYLPLHLSPMGMRLGGKTGDCPVSESVSERLLRLPFYNLLGSNEQARVIEAISDLRF